MAGVWLVITPCTQRLCHIPDKRRPRPIGWLAKHPGRRVPRHPVATQPVAPFGTEGRHDPDRPAKRPADVYQRSAYADDKIHGAHRGGGFFEVFALFRPAVNIDAKTFGRLIHLIATIGVLEIDKMRAGELQDRTPRIERE